MTVNKEKWQEIAEKYDSKAKWAEAIILLNPEDHEDLISALIELDPQDLVGSSGGPEVYLNFSGPSTSALISEADEDIVKIINRELGRVI